MTVTKWFFTVGVASLLGQWHIPAWGMGKNPKPAQESAPPTPAAPVEKSTTDTTVPPKAPLTIDPKIPERMTTPGNIMNPASPGTSGTSGMGGGTSGGGTTGGSGK